MRHLITTCLLGLFTFLSHAQENNPLINSGELIKQASDLHDQGKYNESVDILKKIPVSDTNYYYAIYEMALSQTADSQYTAARNTCEKGLAVQNDKWPDLFTLYGNIIDDMGYPERALRIYDSAINLYPAFSQLYLNKGTTLMKLKQYKEAEEVFKQCVLINPYQASSHYKLGACALQQGLMIQAFLSHINYLLLQPSGYYKNACITSLSTISKAGDDIREQIEKRTADQNDNFNTIEKIILSKIALNNQYKPLLKLDDAISRQIQVLFEKLEYDESDADFWMQYYVPLFKKIFEENKFEPFINRLFASVDIKPIQDYIKKKEKVIQEVVDEAVSYYDHISNTREINYTARKDMNVLYHHDKGRLFGKGNARDNGETLIGDWEFYYYTGNLSSKGSYNEKGEQNGPWEFYYFNGRLKGRQTYKDGKLDGKEIFYYSNDIVSTDATFKNGNEDGETKSYYFIGTPRTVGHYSMGKLNGERRTFFANGSLKSIENYKDGELDGSFKNYHDNGSLESEGSYSNGNLDGAYKTYFFNGKLLTEGTYIAGKLNGTLKEYHENGKLKLQEAVADGLAEGECVEYYNNGQLFYKCNFKKGKTSGDVEYYDKDGKLYSIYTFSNGIVKLARFFDKNGKEIGRSERKSKTLDLTTYYPGGYKHLQSVYNDAGEIIGPETYFFPSGKPSQENIYEKGVLEGVSTGYFPNGKKETTINYKEGEKHGYYKSWYIHGQLEQEGWYQDGQLQGTWFIYDEIGNTSSISQYLNDDLNGIKEDFFPNGKKSSDTKYSKGWIEEYIQYDTTGKEINRCTFKNGNGKYKDVFFNGKTYAEGTYVNSELEGPYKFYYFDGKLNSLYFYKKGKPDSVYRNYYYNGQVYMEGQYKWGKKDDIWKSYFPSGKLSYTEFYENGEITGKKIYYFENGKTDTEIEMEKDERNGWTKKYDDQGNLLYQVRFINDLPVAYTYQDKTGKLLPEIAITAGTGKIKTFFSNGNPSSEFEYTDGKLIGPNLLYFSNGKPRSVSTEDYSLSEGSFKYYYANGQLQNDYIFLHDNLHGPYKEYNEKGIVTEEGYYYNGQPHNIMKTYDDNGKLKETRLYYYGKLLDLKK